MRIAAIVAVLLALASPVAASAIRIDLTKTNQATAPLKYTLTTSIASGLVSVRIQIPRKQQPLTHLWRVDIIMRSGTKTLLAAPLETKLVNGDLETELLLDAANLKGAEIWIRTGEHAPLAETIYAIDIASFK